MGVRLTAVNEIDINVVGHGSILLVGDGGKASLENRTIAILINSPHLSGSIDRNYEDYPVFHRNPSPMPPSSGEVSLTRENEIPILSVQRVRVVAASAASLIQAGSIGEILSISRVLQIRQYRR